MCNTLLVRSRGTHMECTCAMNSCRQQQTNPDRQPRTLDLHLPSHVNTHAERGAHDRAEGHICLRVRMDASVGVEG
jgi:hypothetical protein